MKKRDDGRLEKKVCIGKKETGRFDKNGRPILARVYRSVYGSSEKELQSKINQLEVLVGKGLDIRKSEDPFIEWAKQYLEEKEAEDIGLSHKANLRSFVNHLKPIHEMPICDIRIGHIKRIVKDKATDEKDDKGKVIRPALAKRTIAGIVQCARSVFCLAIEERALEFNPADYVKVPKDTSETTRDALTREQQMWVTTFEHRAKRAAMLMLYAGLRKGEVGALTWGDINLREGYIKIDKAVEFVCGQPELKAPKTKAGIRTVDIPDLLVEYLRAEREKDDCIYVVHTQDGKMLSRTTWRFIWRSYMKDLNVEFGYTKNARIRLGIAPDKKIRKNVPGGLEIIIDTFTPHQLRHTFATNCYHAEIPVEVCRDWMGHSNVKTTLNIYTHLDKYYKRRKKTKLDEFFAQLNRGSESESA